MKKPVKTIVLFLLLATLLLAACTPPNESILEAPASLLAEEAAKVPASASQLTAPEDTASEPLIRSGEKKILTTGSLTQGKYNLNWTIDHDSTTNFKSIQMVSSWVDSENNARTVTKRYIRTFSPAR